jgi:hypothetical protein
LALRVGLVGLGQETGSGLAHGLGGTASVCFIGLSGLVACGGLFLLGLLPGCTRGVSLLGGLLRQLGGLVSAGNKQPTQNWHGPGESDCLIKTKHCAAPRGLRRNVISAQCSECQSEEIHPSAGKRRE